MTQFNFEIIFTPKTKDPKSYVFTPEIKSTITQLVTKLDPKPESLLFDHYNKTFPCDYDNKGFFCLAFVIDSDSQLGAAEIASKLSDQVAQWNLPMYSHSTSNPKDW